MKALIIRNKIPFTIKDDFEKFTDWFKRKTGQDVSFTFLDTELPLVFKDLYNGGNKWGIDDVRGLIKKSGLVKEKYDWIVFIYHTPDYEYLNVPKFVFSHPDDGLGCPVSEGGTRTDWEQADDIFRWMSHEIIHSLYFTLRDKHGIVLQDTMDVGIDRPDWNEREFIVENPNGNREENLARLRPYFPVLFPPVAEDDPVRRQKLLTLRDLASQVVALLQKLVARQTKKTLVDALIQVESQGNDKAIGDLHLQNKAYGPLQIRQPYMDDAMPGHKAQECLGNRKLSIDVFNAYMSRYATPERLGRPVTDEDRARIHNGGPDGYKHTSTLPYWTKVKALL